MKIKQYIILVFIRAVIALVFTGKSDTQEDFKQVKRVTQGIT